MDQSPDFGAFLAQLPGVPKAYKGAVRETADFRRIRDALRRDWHTQSDLADGIARLSQALRTPQGTQTLLPVQAATLRDLYEVGGCFAPVETGGGKTLISLLAPVVVRAQRPLLLVPAKLREKTLREARGYAQHWQLRPIRIMSYESLGRVSQSDALIRYAPDLIVGDETHFLKNTKAAVTRRLRRCIEAHRPRQLWMSGSITSRTIRDYWHLLRWALGDAAPLPTHPMEALSWSWALDEKISEMQRIAPGALLELSPPDPEDEAPDAYGGEANDLTRARRRYARRLLSTRGVVGSSSGMPPCGLICQIDTVPPSQAIQDAVDEMRFTWETPCGLPFETAMDLWRHERELSCGMYYRWKVQPPKEWLEARKAWSGFCREVLARSRTYDTPMQVGEACISGALQDFGVYAAWKQIEPSFKPDTEAVWICDSKLQYAADWLKEHKGICWVVHTAFGHVLSAGTGVPFFQEQGKSAQGITIDMHDGPAIASLQSCREGFNLQARMNGSRAAHYRNLFITSPTKNAPLEQAISRTHRYGQEHDDVYVTFAQSLDGDKKALDQCRRDALYVADTTRRPQRLTVATWL